MPTFGHNFHPSSSCTDIRACAFCVQPRRSRYPLMYPAMSPAVCPAMMHMVYVTLLWLCLGTKCWCHLVNSREENMVRLRNKYGMFPWDEALRNWLVMLDFKQDGLSILLGHVCGLPSTPQPPTLSSVFAFQKYIVPNRLLVLYHRYILCVNPWIWRVYFFSSRCSRWLPISSAIGQDHDWVLWLIILNSTYNIYYTPTTPLTACTVYIWG